MTSCLNRPREKKEKSRQRYNIITQELKVQNVHVLNIYSIRDGLFIQELQFHRDFQRQMVQNLKAHNKRGVYIRTYIPSFLYSLRYIYIYHIMHMFIIVMEHKKMVKKKLGDFGPVSHTCQDPSPESPLSGLPEEGCTVQQDTPPHQSYERELPSRAGQTSRMQQILNCKCKSLGNLLPLILQ